MKFNISFTAALATILLSSIPQIPTTVNALTVPEHAIEARAISHIQPLDDAQEVSDRLHFVALEKRKGGGGGGGRSGGGSSSSGSSGSSGSSSGGSRGSTSTGGSTGSVGTGSRGVGFVGGSRTYGNKYIGGAASPYRSGGRSARGLVPFLLPLAAIGLIFPGLWLYSVYSYPYNTPYDYFNETLNQNISLPVQCLCQEFAQCGCDDDGDNAYLGDLIALNQRNTTVFAEVEGVQTLLLNGTLPNITTEDASEAGSSVPQNSGSKLAALGYGYMVAVVGYMVYAM